MKKIKEFMFLVLLMTVTEVTGQESFEADLGADVVSSYVWRGQKLDDGAIQPFLSLAYKDFSLGAWGSIGLVSGDYKELDMSLTYSRQGFSVVLTDYWCADSHSRYFDFSDRTIHVLEAGIGYDCTFFAVSWFTNILGSTGTDGDGNDVLSSYFEVSAPFSLGGLDWTAAIGATPFETTYYGVDGFNVINCSLTASKDIEIGSAVIPAYAQLMANPSADKLYLTFGVSF